MALHANLSLNAMSETTEGSELQNGFQPQPRPEPEPESELKVESQPEQQPEEELKPEPVVTDVDPKPEPNNESSIQSNETTKQASTDQVAPPGRRKDEENRAFTMRELLSELKSDEDDAGSPYRYFLFSFSFRVSVDQKITLFNL